VSGYSGEFFNFSREGKHNLVTFLVWVHIVSKRALAFLPISIISDTAFSFCVIAICRPRRAIRCNTQTSSSSSSRVISASEHRSAWLMVTRSIRCPDLLQALIGSVPFTRGHNLKPPDVPDPPWSPCRTLPRTPSRLRCFPDVMGVRNRNHMPNANIPSSMSRSCDSPPTHTHTHTHTLHSQTSDVASFVSHGVSSSAQSARLFSRTPSLSPLCR